VNLHPISEPGEMRIGAEDPMINGLRQMTTEQLLHLGERQVVYLRAGTCDGEMRFVLFGADGTPLVQTDAVATAVEMAAEQGLKFISIH
jgi:hypothetical protein